MKSIEIKVFSELYGTTSAVIDNIEQAIKTGLCPCGDGTDYKLTPHELDQLREGIIDNFTPSCSLKYPLNFVALMNISDNKLLLPTGFMFNKQQYADVKRVCQTAGGVYVKNAFVFQEDARQVYYRIINGEDYNKKKKFQAFFTPDELADKIVELADIQPDDEVLEPSAGQGAIVKAIQRETWLGRTVWGYEIMPENSSVVDKIIGYRNLGDDFLKQCDTSFDKIIANPPFSKNQDIDHIYKMYACLKPGGRLVSVASTHWQKTGFKKETAFRAWLQTVKAEIIPIEAGAFKESGTTIPTVIIVINNKK